jgi:hypothetical protein
MGPDPFDDYAPQESQSPNQVSPRRKSFSRIEEAEDEDEEEEEEEPPQHTGRPVKKAKTEAKKSHKAQTHSKSKKENRCMPFISCRPFYFIFNI